MIKAHLFEAWEDIPRFRIKRGQTLAHVYSDRNVAELMMWARQNGVSAAWFQRHARMPHFDLWGSRLRLTKGLSRVTDREMVRDMKVLAERKRAKAAVRTGGPR